MSAPWGDEETQRAEKHLLSLARRLHTSIHFTPDRHRWQAHLTTAQVWVPEPSRAVDYLVGLHELGHIGSKVAQQWTDRYGEVGAEALVEGAAWAWATMVALPQLVSIMEGEDWVELASFFLSYLRAAAYMSPPARRSQAPI